MLDDLCCIIECLHFVVGSVADFEWLSIIFPQSRLLLTVILHGVSIVLSSATDWTLEESQLEVSDHSNLKTEASSEEFPTEETKILGQP